MTLKRDEAQVRSLNIEVEKYDIHLDLSEAKNSANFSAQTSITFFSKLPSTYLDLDALEVESLVINGRKTPISFANERLVLEGLDTVSLNEVIVHTRSKYSRTGEGLHKYTDPEDSQVYLYTQYEPFDAHRVYPCFDQPDLKARWNFSITAPSDWVVLSNGAETSCEKVGTEFSVWKFAQTELLSSYITAIVAGPYAKVEGGTWKKNDGTLEIPLAFYCRKTLLEHFDTDDIERVTRQGFDFFHQKYGYDYPWGKYDQIYVPEYNLGAMENPGCVTFNEKLIVRGGPSRLEKLTRSNTILHEMCHMWFGDLVTPAWWADLWLKESFADNQGYFAQAAATEYKEAWTSFAISRKAWAYEQDLRSTTHPIMADIPDLDAAKQNFDGITYAKGSAVLKQLALHVGEENFFGAAQRYFASHAFSSTNFSDLITALEEQTERKLECWVESWLKTCGPSIISVTRMGHTLSLEQSNAGSEEVIRPHTFTLEFYGEDASVGPLSVRKIEMTSSQETLNLSEEEANATLIVPNAQDETYAVIRLDDNSLRTALLQVGQVPAGITRAVIWQSLWMSVYDGLLPAKDFVSAVCLHMPNEELDILTEPCLNRAQMALRIFTSDAKRPAPLATFLEVAEKEIHKSGISPERLRAWMKTYAILAPSADKDQQIEENLRMWFKNEELKSPRLKWQILISLAAAGYLGEAEIRDLGSFDSSGEAQDFLETALAARPEIKVKEQIWRQVIEKDLGNEALSAKLEGLNRVEQRNVLQNYSANFFREVRAFWEKNSIGMGTRFVRGAFPTAFDVSESKNESHPVVEQANVWLTDNSDAPAALIRLITEGRDDLLRILKAQEQ
ncbi:aminopeptidase N [Actinomycetaceae bacterium TAE3-ERU4]|nr:aminopeptidase N [Actinomycetaceae bacterium TAE3-ERU4]